MYYKNGSLYQGDYQNDKREGKGLIYYKNGDKNEGDFKNIIIGRKGNILL